MLFGLIQTRKHTDTERGQYAPLNPETALKTPLGHARGLGSAKDGVHHWWMQRVTSIALVPLTLWLIFSMALLASRPHGFVMQWLKSPITATMLLLTILMSFYHAILGVQVVIEDYVSSKGRHIILLLLVQAALFVMGTVCTLSVLQIALR